MYDEYLKKKKNNILNIIIPDRLLYDKINANHLTFFGLISGIISIVFLYENIFSYALFFWLINRIFDGLDGFLARRRKISKLGAYFDIVADFIIYGGIMVVLIYNNRYSNFSLMIGLILLFLFYINTISWTYIMILNGKQKLPRAFIEGFETFILYTILLIFIDYFILISSVFSLFMIVTIIQRVNYAYNEFSISLRIKNI